MNAPARKTPPRKQAPPAPLLVRLLPLLVLASGASSLIYESLWMRSFGLIFGNTTYAVSVILATFMGGMAIGSFVAVRLPFRRILHSYALVELAIGLTALASYFALQALPGWYAAMVGAQAGPALELLLRVLLAAVIILPTTFFAGMTFPLLVEFLTRRTKDLHANLSFLYFVNTLGGAIGTFAGVFLLLPKLGVFGATLVGVALNLVVALAVRLLAAGVPECAPDAATSTTTTPATQPRLHALFFTLALASGFISFGLENLWTRSYALIIGSSVYAFNLMLLSVLLGIITGTFIYERIHRRISRSTLWIAVLLLAMGVLILLNLWVIGRLPLVYFTLMKKVTAAFGSYQMLGFGLCFLTMLPITILFGFLFPLLAHQVREAGHGAKEISGKLYGWNTIGAIGGAFLTGFVLIPLSGVQGPYAWLAGMALLLGWLMLARGLAWRRPLALGGSVALAAVVVALGVGYRPWDRLVMTTGMYQYGLEWRATDASASTLLDGLRKARNIQFYKEGRECTVSVTKEGNDFFLAVNGKIDAGTGRSDTITQKLIAHVPLMLHPDPKTALVIGWGSGCTSGAAAMYPLQSIDCVEIEPAVYDTRRYFSAINHDVDRDPRLKIIYKDGRNHLLASRKSYDVIMSEPSNPWVSGVNNLFTTDCYRIVKEHLNDGGIFCQWFHYYNMTLADIKVQTRTFLSVFPEASCWVIPPTLTGEGSNKLTGDMLFIGSAQPHALDYKRLEAMFGNERIRQDLAATGVIPDPLSFATNQTLLREDMVRFAGDGPLNTDNTPWIEIQAPKGMYAASPAESQERGAVIMAALEQAGSSSLPRLVNFAPLAAGAPVAARVQALVELGGIYQFKSMFAKATLVLDEALRLDPGNAPAHATRGEVACITGRFQEGEADCLRAIALDPALKRPYEILGSVYLQRKDYAKAREICDRLLAQFPDDALACYGKAYALAQEGNLTAALEYATKARAMDPGSEMIGRLYNQLVQAVGR